MSAKILLVLAGIAHLVERHLAKVEVASSSLVARSSSEILTTVPFLVLPETALWWEFFCFPPRLASPDSRRSRDGRCGLGSASL